MILKINGENHELPDGLTLSELIERLDMKADRLAIELNRDIVARPKWAETTLNNGDQLEIVHFVGGG